MEAPGQQELMRQILAPPSPAPAGSGGGRSSWRDKVGLGPALTSHVVARGQGWELAVGKAGLLVQYGSGPGLGGGANPERGRQKRNPDTGHLHGPPAARACLSPGQTRKRAQAGSGDMFKVTQ